VIPAWATLVVQVRMAGDAQVEPKPSITVKVAAEAGCAGARMPAHRAVSAAAATAIRRACVPRAVLMSLGTLTLRTYFPPQRG
jgi:hypothetical protein